MVTVDCYTPPSRWRPSTRCSASRDWAGPHTVSSRFMIVPWARHWGRSIHATWRAGSQPEDPTCRDGRPDGRGALPGPAVCPGPVRIAGRSVWVPSGSWWSGADLAC